MRVAMYGTKHPHTGSVARALTDCADIDFCGVFEPDPAQVQKALADPRLAGALDGVAWFGSAAEMLGDATIVGVACEGDNAESLGMTAEIIAAGNRAANSRGPGGVPGGSHRTPSHPVEGSLDPLQIGTAP